MISNNIEYTLSQLPIYQTNLQIVVDNLAEGFGLSNAPSLNKIIENWWKSIDLQSFAFRAFGSISSVGSILFMTALYAGFLLTEVNNFNAKISKALGGDATQALEIISKVNNRIGVYLTIKTIINIILASISFLIMWVMGIDSAVFWAVMIGFLKLYTLCRFSDWCWFSCWISISTIWLSSMGYTSSGIINGCANICWKHT